MISEREKLIGKRLRAFREGLQIPRAAFAATVGFGSERMAAYEAGRARLPYAVFRAIANRYDLYPGWLADGQGSPQIKNSFDDADFIGEIPRHLLFTEVYDKFLASRIAAFRKNARLDAIETLRLIEGFITILQDKTLTPKEKSEIEKIVRPSLEQFAKVLHDYNDDKSNAIDRVLSKLLGERENQGLPTITDSGNVGGVKAKLPALLKRLNDATAERGTKTELAKFMGVPLPNVSQWLSGEREPSGENTLQLLQWVEQRERQK